MKTYLFMFLTSLIIGHKVLLAVSRSYFKSFFSFSWVVKKCWTSSRLTMLPHPMQCHLQQLPCTCRVQPPNYLIWPYHVIYFIQEKRVNLAVCSISLGSQVSIAVKAQPSCPKNMYMQTLWTKRAKWTSCYLKPILPSII
jgi:hypothetical protein